MMNVTYTTIHIHSSNCDFHGVAWRILVFHFVLRPVQKLRQWLEAHGAQISRLWVGQTADDRKEERKNSFLSKIVFNSIQLFSLIIHTYIYI